MLGGRASVSQLWARSVPHAVSTMKLFIRLLVASAAMGSTTAFNLKVSAPGRASTHLSSNSNKASPEGVSRRALLEKARYTHPFGLVCMHYSNGIREGSGVAGGTREDRVCRRAGACLLKHDTAHTRHYLSEVHNNTRRCVDLCAYNIMIVPPCDLHGRSRGWRFAPLSCIFPSTLVYHRAVCRSSC